MIKKLLIVFALITIVPSIAGGIVKKRIDNLSSLVSTIWQYNGIYSTRPSSSKLFSITFLADGTQYRGIQFGSGGGIQFVKENGTYVYMVQSGNLVASNMSMIYLSGGSDIASSDLLYYLSANFTRLGVSN